MKLVVSYFGDILLPWDLNYFWYLKKLSICFLSENCTGQHCNLCQLNWTASESCNKTTCPCLQENTQKNEWTKQNMFWTSQAQTWTQWECFFKIWKNKLMQVKPQILLSWSNLLWKNRSEYSYSDVRNCSPIIGWFCCSYCS